MSLSVGEGGGVSAREFKATLAERIELISRVAEAEIRRTKREGVGAECEIEQRLFHRTVSHAEDINGPAFGGLRQPGSKFGRDDCLWKRREYLRWWAAAEN